MKGTVTRVGARLVKCSVSLQLRTQPACVLALAGGQAVHIHALEALHTHLCEAVDLVSSVLAKPPTAPGVPPDVASLARTLALLSDSLDASASLLKGGSTLHATAAAASSEPDWQTLSCPPGKFSPPLPPNLSVHVGIRDSAIVLSIRSLEPVDAPLHIGTRLGLAIGTFRRLEHDEMDATFRWNPAGADGVHGVVRRGDLPRLPRRASLQGGGHARRPSTAPAGNDGQGQGSLQGGQHPGGLQEVHVREKVRVESADPCLISLYAKVGYLSHMLGQTRRNLAAVMGEEL